MGVRRRRAFLQPLGFFGALLLASAPAAAQQVSTVLATNQRYLPSGQQYPIRPTNQNPATINRADCNADIAVQFNVALSGVIDPNNTLQVWASSAGGDCSVYEQRSGGSRTCWAVTGPLSRVQNQNVLVRAQDLANYIGKASTDLPNGYQAAGRAACAVPSSVGQTNVTLYFLVIDGGGQTVSAGQSKVVPIDVIGPAPPTNVRSTPGNRALIVDWDYTDSASVLSWNIYAVDITLLPQTDVDASLVCTDAGAGETQDASAGDAASSDAASSSGVQCVAATDAAAASSSCASSFLTPFVGVTDGSLPDPSFLTQSVAGGISREARVAGLENGHRYAIAIAALDSVGNAGGLSTLTDASCNNPDTTIGFWDRYRSEGGAAGGASCGVDGMERGGGGGSLAAAVVALVGAAGAALRRRRRT